MAAALQDGRGLKIQAAIIRSFILAASLDCPLVIFPDLAAYKLRDSAVRRPSMLSDEVMSKSPILSDTTFFMISA